MAEAADEWLSEVCDFVREHFRISQTWEPEALENWILWAATNDFLCIAYDSLDSRNMVGLTIFRPISLARASDAKNIRPDGQYDEDGEVIYVDLCISSQGKPVLQVLLFGILSRLGNRPLIAFKMFKRDKVKLHALSTFKQILFNRGKQSQGFNHGKE